VVFAPSDACSAVSSQRNSPTVLYGPPPICASTPSPARLGAASGLAPRADRTPAVDGADGVRSAYLCAPTPPTVFRRCTVSRSQTPPPALPPSKKKNKDPGCTTPHPDGLSVSRRARPALSPATATSPTIPSSRTSPFFRLVPRRRWSPVPAAATSSPWTPRSLALVLVQTAARAAGYPASRVRLPAPPGRPRASRSMACAASVTTTPPW